MIDAGRDAAAVAPPDEVAVRPPHAENMDRLLERLAVEPVSGLSGDEVQTRLREHGPNQLAEAPRKSAFLRLLGQFANPLVLTLLGAAAIAVMVGITSGGENSFLSKFGDALAILLIVAVNAALGFVQENRAEAALEALKGMTAPTARVRRGGQVTVVVCRMRPTAPARPTSPSHTFKCSISGRRWNTAGCRWSSTRRTRDRT